MITIKKLKSLVLVAALFGGMSVFAQQPQPQMQQEQAQTEVKDSELEEFATIAQGVMQKNQEAQQEMLNEIEKEGLTGDRYNELHMAEQNPSAIEDKPSQEELDKKQRVDEKLGKLEEKIQQESVKIIEDAGMSIDRYQEIAQAVQSDQNLMEKYQKIVMEKAQNSAE